jgi:hypothetical protein
VALLSRSRMRQSIALLAWRIARQANATFVE